EVIGKLIATSRAPTPEEAIAACMRRIGGAYTVVAMLGDLLAAFRDANGIRPLALGRLGNAVVVASESCAFDQIGGEYIREVGPGELVLADREGVRSIAVLPVVRRAACVYEYIYFARP